MIGEIELSGEKGDDGMIELEARFRVVTPLFMGGADPMRTELRLSGIKGVLRFWWRALAWCEHEGSLKRIREEEGEIFGSAEKGQSCAIMRLIVNKNEKNPEIQGPGLRYLGYGLFEQKENRERIPSPVSDFSVLFNIRQGKCRDLDAEYVREQLIRALKVMGLLGGIGARSRRGWGSLTLTGLIENGTNLFSPPEDLDTFKRCIQESIPFEKLSDELPPYTAFSQCTRIFSLDEGNQALGVLNRVGENMVEYRGGNRRRGENRRFSRDTSLMKSIATRVIKESDIERLQNNPKQNHPERATFGLPHNYYFKKDKIELRVSPENHERRASPLFIHIHDLTRAKYIAVASLIPAKFLPDEGKIRIARIMKEEGDGSEERNDLVVPFSDGNFRVIHEFLEDYKKSCIFPPGGS